MIRTVATAADRNSNSSGRAASPQKRPKKKDFAAAFHANHASMDDFDFDASEGDCSWASELCENNLAQQIQQKVKTVKPKVLKITNDDETWFSEVSEAEGDHDDTKSAIKAASVRRGGPDAPKRRRRKVQAKQPPPKNSLKSGNGIKSPINVGDQMLLQPHPRKQASSDGDHDNDNDDDDSIEDNLLLNFSANFDAFGTENSVSQIDGGDLDSQGTTTNNSTSLYSESPFEEPVVPSSTSPNNTNLFDENDDNDPPHFFDAFGGASAAAVPFDDVFGTAAAAAPMPNVSSTSVSVDANSSPLVVEHNSCATSIEPTTTESTSSSTPSSPASSKGGTNDNKPRIVSAGKALAMRPVPPSPKKNKTTVTVAPLLTASSDHSSSPPSPQASRRNKSSGSSNESDGDKDDGGCLNTHDDMSPDLFVPSGNDESSPSPQNDQEEGATTSPRQQRQYSWLDAIKDIKKDPAEAEEMDGGFEPFERFSSTDNSMENTPSMDSSVNAPAQSNACPRNNKLTHSPKAHGAQAHTRAGADKKIMSSLSVKAKAMAMKDKPGDQNKSGDIEKASGHSIHSADDIVSQGMGRFYMQPKKFDPLSSSDHGPRRHAARGAAFIAKARPTRKQDGSTANVGVDGRRKIVKKVASKETGATTTGQSVKKRVIRRSTINTGRPANEAHTESEKPGEKAAGAMKPGPRACNRRSTITNPLPKDSGDEAPPSVLHSGLGNKPLAMKPVAARARPRQSAIANSVPQDSSDEAPQSLPDPAPATATATGTSSSPAPAAAAAPAPVRKKVMRRRSNDGPGGTGGSIAGKPRKLKPGAKGSAGSVGPASASQVTTTKRQMSMVHSELKQGLKRVMTRPTQGTAKINGGKLQANKRASKTSIDGTATTTGNKAPAGKPASITSLNQALLAAQAKARPSMLRKASSARSLPATRATEIEGSSEAWEPQKVLQSAAGLASQGVLGQPAPSLRRGQSLGYEDGHPGPSAPALRRGQSLGFEGNNKSAAGSGAPAFAYNTSAPALNFNSSGNSFGDFNSSWNQNNSASNLDQHMIARRPKKTGRPSGSASLAGHELNMKKKTRGPSADLSSLPGPQATRRPTGAASVSGDQVSRRPIAKRPGQRATQGKGSGDEGTVVRPRRKTSVAGGDATASSTVARKLVRPYRQSSV